MPFLLAEILNFQGSTHHIGVGSFSYLFFRTQDVYETYLELKKRQKELESQCGGTEEERYQLAVDFGALLSYPKQGIRRLIEKTREARR